MNGRRVTDPFGWADLGLGLEPDRSGRPGAVCVGHDAISSSRRGSWRDQFCGGAGGTTVIYGLCVLAVAVLGRRCLVSRRRAGAVFAAAAALVFAAFLCDANLSELRQAFGWPRPAALGAVLALFVLYWPWRRGSARGKPACCWRCWPSGPERYRRGGRGVLCPARRSCFRPGNRTSTSR